MHGNDTRVIQPLFSCTALRVHSLYSWLLHSMRNAVQYLYETGNKFAIRYYNHCKKEGKPTNGVMNTYLTGFKAGIKQVLEKQCTALMIVTPQKVIDAYDEKVQGAKVHTIKIKSAKDTDAYNEGKFDGKSMIEQKMLAV